MQSPRTYTLAKNRWGRRPGSSLSILRLDPLPGDASVTTRADGVARKLQSPALDGLLDTPAAEFRKSRVGGKPSDVTLDIHRAGASRAAVHVAQDQGIEPHGRLRSVRTPPAPAAAPRRRRSPGGQTAEQIALREGLADTDLDAGRRCRGPGADVPALHCKHVFELRHPPAPAPRTAKSVGSANDTCPTWPGRRAGHRIPRPCAGPRLSTGPCMANPVATLTSPPSRSRGPRRPRPPGW